MSHYQLSEDQEFAIYETRHAMRGIMGLVDAIPPDKQISLNAEEVAALLSLLSARLPKSDEMLFVPHG